MGKTRKKKAREKLAGVLSPVSSSFIFLFSLSQFSGPDYLGAWNRLAHAFSTFPCCTLQLPLKTKRRSDSLHIPFTTLLYSFALFKMGGIPKMEYCEIRSRVHSSQFLNVCLFNAMYIRPDSNVAFHI